MLISSRRFGKMKIENREFKNIIWNRQQYSIKNDNIGKNNWNPVIMSYYYRLILKDPITENKNQIYSKINKVTIKKSFIRLNNKIVSWRNKSKSLTVEFISTNNKFRN